MLKNKLTVGSKVEFTDDYGKFCTPEFLGIELEIIWVTMMAHGSISRGGYNYFVATVKFRSGGETKIDHVGMGWLKKWGGGCENTAEKSLEKEAEINGTQNNIIYDIF